MNKDNQPFKKFYKDSKKTTGASEKDEPRKTSARSGKSFKKPVDKEGHPAKRSFSKEDRPYKGTFGKDERPVRKSFDKEDRSTKRSFGKEDRPYKKTFGKDERPAHKPFDKEDRPYKKTFDKGERPARKPFDKGSQSHKKPFGKDDYPSKKSNKEGDHAGSKSFSKPKRSFGKFEEADLSFGKRKKPEIKQEEIEPQEPEITFSKSIENKWETAPVKPPYGKAGAKDITAKREHRHLPKDKFKRHFDEENPHEKAFESSGNSRRKHIEEGSYYDGKALEGLMPLNKFIAHCDVCSRRDAVALIKEGKVKVNGELITEPGHRVTLEDQITLSGKKLVVQKNLIYILLNKPKGFITTTDDPKGRKTVMDIFENHIEERIFPIGRLDRNTTGLLLLTNDGELTQDLAHPKYEIRKVYQVTLDKPLTEADYTKIREGVILEDGPAPVDQLEYLNAPNELGLEIHNGKNRIVRRIFESLGYVVDKLDRVMYAGLTKKNLVRGKWRFLTKQEVINLKHLR